MSIITGNKPRQILTIDDLMERWGVERDTVHRHIDNDGLQFLPVGHEA